MCDEFLLKYILSIHFYFMTKIINLKFPCDCCETSVLKCNINLAFESNVAMHSSNVLGAFRGQEK